MTNIITAIKKSVKRLIAEHIQRHTFTEEMVGPQHEERTTSPLFLQSKKQLKQDGHFKCYVCGTTENLESHHFGCEKSEENVCDMQLLELYLIEHDIYGYSHAMLGTPIISTDDVRNQMILCTCHHREKGTGIHNMTHGFWVMQKICKTGQNPVIDPDEPKEKALERVL